MKCQSLFPGRNKKNISKCCLLKILSRVLIVNNISFCMKTYNLPEENNTIIPPLFGTLQVTKYIFHGQTVLICSQVSVILLICV